MAIIDVGLKVEGRVAAEGIRRQGQGRRRSTSATTVEVYLERIENALGEAVLSREKARREESWVRLEAKFEAGEKVEGVIFNQVKGGFTVDLDGAVAFLPRSQVDIRPVRDVTPLMNNPQPFQILKMDKRRGNIVVSRRTVLEESRAEQRSEIVQNLEEGQVSKASSRTSPTTVRSSISAASTACCTSPTWHGAASTIRPKILSIGQTVKVQIIRINQETHRISLGMKQLRPIRGKASKPSTRSARSSPVRVTNITDYGAFVELEPGIEGLIHVSEMSWTKKNVHPGKIVSTSQEVEVVRSSKSTRTSAASRLASSRRWKIRGKLSPEHPVGSVVEGESRTRPSSACSSAWKAMSMAWSTCPTSTGTCRANRPSRTTTRAMVQASGSRC
jgi:small subunit ribosomal protein S1